MLAQFIPLENIRQENIGYYLYVTDRNIIGSRLRKARKAAKPAVTQLDLVARLQLLGIAIDQSAISKIEAGQRPVFDFEIAALAKALKLPVAYFFENTKATARLKRQQRNH